MTALDEDALKASVDLIGRSGARDLEIGYADDTATLAAAADWYAVCSYRGTKLITEHHQGPLEAVEALSRRILAGVLCTHCGGLVALSDAGTTIHDGAVMADGSTMTADRARRLPQCRWRRVEDRWVRGCETPTRAQPRRRT
jgi:hypothetical protein